MEQTSEEPVGTTGAIGKIADLVISLKGLVAALSVLGGLLGLYVVGDKPSTPGNDAQATFGPSTPGPAPAPQSKATEGWAVVGNYATGKLTSPLIKIKLSIPQVGETCEALDNFSVFKKYPADQPGTGNILLGDVHKGDTIEVLDMRRRDEEGAHFWVKLRAVLHSH